MSRQQNTNTNTHTHTHTQTHTSLSLPLLLMDSPSRSSVIIIGAGVSGNWQPIQIYINTYNLKLKIKQFLFSFLCQGISAGKVLAENGMEDMIILEASDRIGGRIRKENFGGVSAELGAGWIAGVGGKESNPVWELASQSGLRTCFSDYSNARYNIYDRRYLYTCPPRILSFLSSFKWKMTQHLDTEQRKISKRNSLWMLKKVDFFCCVVGAVGKYFPVEWRQTLTRRRWTQQLRSWGV